MAETLAGTVALVIDAPTEEWDQMVAINVMGRDA